MFGNHLTFIFEDPHNIDWSIGLPDANYKAKYMRQWDNLSSESLEADSKCKLKVDKITGAKVVTGAGRRDKGAEADLYSQMHSYKKCKVERWTNCLPCFLWKNADQKELQHMLLSDLDHAKGFIDWVFLNNIRFSQAHRKDPDTKEFFDFVREGDIGTALNILSVVEVSQNPTSTADDSVAARSTRSTSGKKGLLSSMKSFISSQSSK